MEYAKFMNYGQYILDSEPTKQRASKNHSWERMTETWWKMRISGPGMHEYQIHLAMFGWSFQHFEGVCPNLWHHETHIHSTGKQTKDVKWSQASLHTLCLQSSTVATHWHCEYLPTAIPSFDSVQTKHHWKCCQSLQDCLLKTPKCAQALDLWCCEPSCPSGPRSCEPRVGVHCPLNRK